MYGSLGFVAGCIMAAALVWLFTGYIPFRRRSVPTYKIQPSLSSSPGERLCPVCKTKYSYYNSYYTTFSFNTCPTCEKRLEQLLADSAPMPEQEKRKKKTVYRSIDDDWKPGK